MRLPLTKSQIEKLGGRLVAAPEVAPADLDQLHQLLTAYGDCLRETTQRVRDELGVAPTARLKNTGTIIEKLERYGGSWLKSIQDVAGMRVVGNFDRSGQDELVARILDLFSHDERPPKIVDRRAAPVRGYRAVHVIVFPYGIPVEIQVRTRRQHEWAELFEKLADHVGRGIRYGEPPAHWLGDHQRRRLREGLNELYEVSYELRVTTVQLAVAVADLISAVEEAEEEAPGDPKLGDLRATADDALTRLRANIDVLRTETLHVS
jgi:ppGpp synthetase/RelA/SpoT-type nucleotidyltranferase